MARQLSTHAAAAKMIRAELKKHGIKARVRSSTFSMGNSVDIYVEDLFPTIVEEIKAYADQFQYGHFDGMTDMYEHSNQREDIPQVKFVTVEARYSIDLQQAAWDYFRGWHAGYDDRPADYNEAQRYDYDVAQQVYRVLNGSQGSFWRDRKPRKRIMGVAK